MGYWGVFAQPHGKTKIVYAPWAQAGNTAITSVYDLAASGILKSIMFELPSVVDVGLCQIALYLDDVQVLPAYTGWSWDNDFDEATREPWISNYAIDGEIMAGYNFGSGIRFDNRLQIKYITTGCAAATTVNCYIWYEELEA